MTDQQGSWRETRCPQCGSTEWFPGASCFHCGWEGSAAEAYEHLQQRIADLEALVSTRARGLLGQLEEAERKIAALESVAREVVYQLNDDGPGNLDEVLDLARDALGDAREGGDRG